MVTKIPNTTLINPNYWNGYHPPFGMQMEERSATYGNRGYRFGFNSKEMDNEVSGVGNQYDYGFRIYNPRLGKFLSIDPLFKSYPWYTPYQFAGNVPIAAIDLDGLEELIVVRWYENGKYKGASAIHIPNARHRVINNNNILYVELDDTRENRSKIKAMQRRKGDWNNAKDLIFDKDENGYKLKQGQVTEATARNKVDQDAFDQYRQFNSDPSNAGRALFRDILLRKQSIKYLQDGDDPFKVQGKEDPRISKLVEILIDNPEYKVNLVGYTNSDGEDNGYDNSDLSVRRAQQLKDYLMKKGVSEDRINVEGRGATELKYKPDGTEDKEASRRVEITPYIERSSS